ncbi:MAG: discoidin domain-containing protein [Desulfobacteraceae bacterium]|nr:discoidin domain-containing protein [Desulfobacteraceae bacterium]
MTSRPPLPWMLLATLLLALAPARLWARELITVNQDAVIRSDFLGINAVYHAFNHLPESQEMGMTGALRAQEMKRLHESGIRLVRSYYRPDWAMGDGSWLAPDWNSPKMKALYAWLADLQKIGVQVALNMGWWFPRDVIWNRDQQLASYPDDLDAYCRWVSESVHQIVQVRGLSNLKYLVMFTEPNDHFGDLPPGKGQWEYYREVVRAVNQRLTKDGRRGLVKLVGPNSTPSPMWLDRATQELNDTLDIYTTHVYDPRSYQEWLAFARQAQTVVAGTGKPLWIDEYGSQDAALRKSGQYGVFLAEANAAFLNAGAQSSFLWLLCDQYYPAPIKNLSNQDSFLDGKHNWGLLPWLPDNQGPRPAWEALVMMARLMGGTGVRVVKTTGPDDLPAASVVDAQGNPSVLLANPSPAAREIEIGFSTPPAPPLYRYDYRADGQPRLKISPAPDRGPDPGANITAALAPFEVTIISGRRPAPDPVLSEMAIKTQGHPPDRNLALNRPVEATSSDPAWPAANLTDGKRLTYWRPADGRASQTAIIDLGQAFTVRQIEILQSSPGLGRGTLLPAAQGKISLACSTDRRIWHSLPLHDHRPNAATALIVPLTPRLARYLRVRYQPPARTASPARTGWFLSEIKVFGH